MQFNYNFDKTSWNKWNLIRIVIKQIEQLHLIIIFMTWQDIITPTVQSSAVIAIQAIFIAILANY